MPKIFLRALAGAAALALLAGCSTMMADMPLIGLPDDAPARAPKQAEYPWLGSKPEERDGKPMNPTERAALEAELKAARDRQAQEAAGSIPPARN